MKKTFAVIGMGRFGSSVAKVLKEEGHEVIAIDSNEHIIETSENNVTHSLILDSTDEDALRDSGIRNVDTVIVAIGSDIQASILTVVNLKELGILHVVAKALNERHGKVLEKVGADRVVYPEREMGERIARSLISSNVIDAFELAEFYSLEEIRVHQKMIGKSLVDLHIRSKYHLNVVAIKNGERVNPTPRAEDTLQEGDILVVVGHNDDLERFANL